MTAIRTCCRSLNKIQRGRTPSTWVEGQGVLESSRMRIGEVARRLGVATSKIRFLEAGGLIGAADRTASGYRDYAEGTVETLRFVLEAQSFGFTLNEIGQSLEATEGSELRCADAI